MSSNNTATTTAQPTHVTESVADRKKSRELAEARQSGAMAPEVDIKTGAMINPHNPEFITKRPWYLGGGEEGPSLDHQGSQKAPAEKLELSMGAADALLAQERTKLKKLQVHSQYQKGMWIEALKHNRMPYRIAKILKVQKRGTVFDLQYEDGTVERKVKLHKNSSSRKPRIRMTKTGNRTLDIDATTYGKETYDSKRDKYFGYDAQDANHMKRVQKTFQQRDELRRQARTKEQQELEQQGDGTNTTKDGEIPSKQQQQQHRAGSDSDDSDYDSDNNNNSDDNESDDEFVQHDEDDKLFTSRLARQGGVGGAQMKVTARNLRIREDTAKYLRNLDPNSAYYDPKSRSMRDNPHPETNPDDVQFAGDNFARISGDAVQLAETQLFAWDAAQKGGIQEIHPQANPSQAEVLKKKFKTKSADLKAQRKKAVLDKYGGEEYLDDATRSTKTKQPNGDDDGDDDTAAAERKARFGVSVTQEEYTRDGRLIKGGVAVKRTALKSKYEEDIHVNGHTTVWGSFFHRGAFRWGYADDHSLLQNSYCTGLNGRKANDDANELRYGTGEAGSAALAQAREMLKAIPSAKGKDSSLQNTNGPPSSQQSKLYGEVDQNIKLDPQKVQEALKKVEKETSKDEDDRKRKYHSMNAQVDVTEEEMEAYRMRKDRTDDPMAKLSSEEVLDYN